MLLHLERSSWCFLCYFCFPVFCVIVFIFLVLWICGFCVFSFLCFLLQLGFSRLLFLFMVTCCFAFVLAWPF
ncbi:hypothetical protein PRUPE_5G023900 [Prunus persica]|uniref:Uncharacterized protein n=1 Tax=Prunus persica TaxID=3760 RepID=A0A251P2L1_PRUPE|nr:hypothetical protein PRUPE_5G023900 [Prunus persica]